MNILADDQHQNEAKTLAQSSINNAAPATSKAFNRLGTKLVEDIAGLPVIGVRSNKDD
jgi:hypothetical protein